LHPSARYSISQGEFTWEIERKISKRAANNAVSRGVADKKAASKIRANSNKGVVRETKASKVVAVSKAAKTGSTE
jgi:hypothetical protein